MVINTWKTRDAGQALYNSWVNVVDVEPAVIQCLTNGFYHKQSVANDLLQPITRPIWKLSKLVGTNRQTKFAQLKNTAQYK